jgi:hypothetical protein
MDQVAEIRRRLEEAEDALPKPRPRQQAEVLDRFKRPWAARRGGAVSVIP